MGVETQFQYRGVRSMPSQADLQRQLWARCNISHIIYDAFPFLVENNWFTSTRNGMVSNGIATKTTLANAWLDRLGRHLGQR